MVLVTIKFLMETNKLSNKKEANERKLRAGEFTVDSKICVDKQVFHAIKNLNT